MPTNVSLFRSFAGGEITPELFSRMDLNNFQTGLAKCLNFITTPHGPAMNRPGLEFVIETKKSTLRSRLIPFAFNTQQTFALEFGEAYIRFHTTGATLLEPAKAITGVTNALPVTITAAGHGYVTGDDVLLSGIVGPASLNGRTAVVVNETANTFQLIDKWGVPIGTVGEPAYVSGGTVARPYEVVSPFNNADVADIHYVQSGDVMTLVHPKYSPRELRRLGATSWTLTTITFSPLVGPPANITGTSTAPGSAGNPVDIAYTVTSLVNGTLEESVGGNTVILTNDLTVVGHYNTITWDDAGVEQYNVYKAESGVFGFIGRAAGLSFKDDNIDPDMTKTNPVNSTPFEGEGNYPSAVNYAQQRRVFAGTLNKPNNVWLTRSGTESNMSSSIPTRDDDAITLRVAASQVNVIRNLVPLADLMMLTSGAEWRLTTANTDVLTPTSVAVKPQSYVGSSNVQPVVANNRLIFAEESGSHLQEVVYSNEAGGYVPSDLSILAPHLFDFDSVTDMAFGRSPTPVVWAVRDDGVLLGLTYVPDQKVSGWHRHETAGGAFEAVCTISENRENTLYAIVRRTVDGRTVRYVERLHTRKFEEAQDAFFVDCGSTYNGTAKTTIEGLYHLEGQTVAVLADGAVVTPRVVQDGAVTLDQAASVVHVGLPITADLQTLPLVLEQAQAFGIGRTKNVNKVHMRVRSSSGVKVGPTFDKLTLAKQRTIEAFGSPPSLIANMLLEIPIQGSWSEDAQVCVRQENPLPLTVVSLALEASIGG